MTRGSAWSTVVVTLGVAVAVVLADRVAPVPEVSDDVPSVAASGAVAGSFVCAVGDRTEGTVLTTTAARPMGLGSGPAQVDIVSFEDGEQQATRLPPVFPGADGRRTPTGDGELGAWVRWSAGPVAVSREWRWTDSEALPQATVAGPCAEPFSGTWIVPGMSTTGGNEAHLRLANPFRSDATVAVHFLTPAGVEAPLILRNITVPARSVREIVVNETLPERDDLAAVVEVATGRVAAEGYQLARSAIGDIDGASLLAAAPQAAEDWTIPWVADGRGWTSWLWVANPGDRTATVELTMHTEDGGEVPDGLSEVTVPPQELRRVDLRGTLPDEQSGAAVTVRSNGAPIVVSAASQRAADDPTRTAFAVQLGSAAPDDLWVVSGGDTAGRDERLRVVNPGGEVATIDIALFSGVTVLRPDELQDVELPPGSVTAFELAELLEGAPGWSAFVTARGGDVVVGRVGTSGQDALHLVAVPGAPASVWTPDAGALASVHDADFVRRLGTSLGVTLDGEEAAEPEQEVPSPDEPADPQPDDPTLDEPADTQD